MKQSLQHLPPVLKATIYQVVCVLTGMTRDLMVGMRGMNLAWTRGILLLCTFPSLWAYERAMERWFGDQEQRTGLQKFAALLILIPVWIGPTCLAYKLLGESSERTVEALGIDLLAAVAIWVSDTLQLLERGRSTLRWWKKRILRDSKGGRAARQG